MKPDCKLEWIVKALSIIENGIEEKCDNAEIKKRILDEIGYNYNYFSELFKNVMGCSLAAYIRRASYRRAYSIWKTERPELKQRDSFEGVDYFLFNFKRTFGVSIDEVEMKGIHIMENVTKEELVEITEFLNRTPIIESYEFNNGTVSLKLDVDMVLVFMLSNKSYVMPKELVENIDWEKISKDTQKMLLVITNKEWEEFDEQNQITLTLEEIEREFILLDSYNMDSPVLFGGYYIFYYDWNNTQLETTFKRNISFLLNQMEIVIPKTNLPKKYETVLQAIRECKGLVSIGRVTQKAGIAEGAVVEILWEMAKRGFLRIKKPGKSIW